MTKPWEEYQAAAAPALAPWEEYQRAAPKKDEGGFIDGAAALIGGVGKGVGTVALGAQKLVGRGLKAVGADGAGQWLVDDADTGRARMAAELAPYKERHPFKAGAGELVGEVVGTLPVGGVLAKGATAALSRAPALMSRAAPLINAVGSSGFRTGATAIGTKAKAADLAIRSAGGAITGGAAAGLIDEDDAALGAAIGGVLPGLLGAAGEGVKLGGRAYRSLTAAPDKEVAEKLAKAIGVPRDELMSALRAEGPSMIPGYQMTVPQIVQSPVISQLQRSLQTAGIQDIADAVSRQQGQYRTALDSIAPADLSIRDAANRAGTAIQNYAIPARQEVSKMVRESFENVDPWDQARLMLPLDQMQGAQAKFLGPGTFGTGSKAQQALDTARAVGTETVEAAKPMSAKGIQDLVLAVRAAGGINTTSKAGRDMAGEIRNLRESGLNNLVKPNTGQSVERMAEKMHEAGFLPDNDPATLLNLLHESAAGNRVFQAGSDDAFQFMQQQANGPGPGAQSYQVPVSFRTLQNLRGSIGEAADQASAKGSNKEAAALDSMKRALDERIEKAANGMADEGDYFPADIAARYREALDMHGAKKRVFDTGPQASMFRRGGDGQAQIQGAEIPGKFYNGNLSQVEDMQSFRRLVGDSPELMGEMKRYAMTEARGTANKAGDLTVKFNQWERSRSGANRELFDGGERALIGEVGKAVQRAGVAEDLGRVSGSDTAQKLASLNELGALDSKVLNIVASRIPILGKITGPMLDGLRETAARTQNKRMAELLADPEKLAAALDSKGNEAMKLRSWLNKNAGRAQLLYRGAPAASANPDE